MENQKLKSLEEELQLYKLRTKTLAKTILCGLAGTYLGGFLGHVFGDYSSSYQPFQLNPLDAGYLLGAMGGTLIGLSKSRRDEKKLMDGQNVSRKSV